MKKSNDIEKSLRRRISGEADMHDERLLRAAAGEDAFVRDAVEGLEAFPEGGHAERITRLKARLRERTARRRVTPIFILSRAAAVLVIGLCGYGAWLFLRETPPGIAEKSVAVPEETTAPAPPPAADQAIATLEERPEAKSPPAPISSRPARRAAAQPESLPYPAAPPLADADNAPREAAAGPIETATQPAATSTPQSAPPPPALSDRTPATTAAEERKIAPAQPKPAAGAPAQYRTLSGKVTDSAGEPLIGASIVLQGTTRGAVTDFDGAFQLNVPADAQQLRLEVHYTGYTSKIVDPGKNDRLNITLDDSGAALSEVVVVGRNKKTTDKRATASAVAETAAMPVGGYQALNNFIQRNKNPQSLSGEVELEFTVSPQGKLSHFKVLRSPGAEHSEEAIRLLRSGPRWQNRSGKAQKVNYTVAF